MKASELAELKASGRRPVKRDPDQPKPMQVVVEPVLSDEHLDELARLVADRAYEHLLARLNA